MARSEARLQFSIWDGLQEVPAIGKYVYMVILTDETINHAGVGRLSVSLWAQNAGLSEDDIERGIAALEREPQIVVDRRTQEILVRTLIRRDRVAEQPYVLKAALKDALRTRSPRLRQVLAGELRKLPHQPPDGMSSTGRPIRYPDPHAAAAELDHQTSDSGPQRGLESLSTASWMSPETHPAPTAEPPETLHREAAGDQCGAGGMVQPAQAAAQARGDGPAPATGPGHQTLPRGPQKGFETLARASAEPPETLHGGGDGGGGGSTPVATQVQRSKDFPAQQTIMPSAAANDGASPLPRKRGSRIPDDFAVDQAMVAWAREHTPNVDGKRETEKFIDYWRSKTGKDATKLDWVATWRNWMRNAEERSPTRHPTQPADSLWGTTGKKLARLQSLKDDPDEPPGQPLLRALPGGA